MAARHFETALDVARSGEMPVAVVRTHLDRLESGLLDHADRDVALDEVVEILVDKRLLGLLERLETLDGRRAAQVRSTLRNEQSPIEPGEAVVLMADIVNSTALTRELGEVDYRHEARRVERIIREGVALQGGRTVEGVKLGDGALAEFSNVDDAARAGLAINAALAQDRLKLRIGINRGPVVREGSELFGSAINLAARACDAAEPGGVMLTDAAADHFDGSWLGALIDHGEFVMKGIDHGVRLLEPVTVEALASSLRDLEPASEQLAPTT